MPDRRESNPPADPAFLRPRADGAGMACRKGWRYRVEGCNTSRRV